jgi:2-polyprenyl-3-methyl-5-hydroxy-6-metoxy-1,4-benzoquinol methylase
LFLEIAKEGGYLATGVEPAEIATETAHSKGLDVRCGFLEDQHFSECYYDVITLFEVIEHLKNPVPLLRECHRILKPGGLMFISTGNAASWTVRFLKKNWDYFDIHKGHISFFNPLSLKKIVHSAGFKVVNFETRSVKIYSKKNIYTKLISEILNLPVKIFKKGHDLLFIVKK